MLRLTLFGRMTVAGPGGEIALGSGKLAALLAFLALAGDRPLPREKVGELLWGSTFEEQSRQSVRQALSRLRKLLGNDVLSADGPMIGLDRALFDCDVTAFRRLARSTEMSDLAAALDLARGELLEGSDVTEPGFTAWLAEERRQLSELAASAALRLGEMELAQGAPDEALRRAVHVLATDPCSEPAHRLRLSALAALDRRSEALQIHRDFAERLKRELGTTPDEATARLAETLRGQPPRTEPQARRASIAVMPFANIGGNPEEDYFADGIVDEIITALWRVKGLHVATRSATFAFKSQAMNACEAGRRLGVAYVLEGTVRRSAGRLRISCQLADAESGESLWAERFEGGIEDVFAFQDQVTARVAASVVPTVERAELHRSQSKPTANLTAYDHYLRGLADVHRWSREANASALRNFYRAIELDRQFAAAYGQAARCFSQKKTSNWSDDPLQDRAEAEGLAHLAVQFGRDDPVALASAGITFAFVAGRLAEGDDLVERALALNGNYPNAWLWSGWIKAWSGEPDASIERVRRAMALSPHDPALSSMRRAIAFALFLAGRYEEAIAEAEAVASAPQNAFAAISSVAASAALLGRLPLAREAMRTLRAIEPRLTVSTLATRFPLRRAEDLRRFGEGLRIAGLPE